MPFRRHVATGRGGPLAIALVLAAALAGGVITGLIEAVVNQWFSLLLLFQLLIGGVAGGLAGWMIGRQRLRAPLLALVLGVAGGAAGEVTVHAVDYAQFRSSLETAERDRATAAGEPAVSLDDVLVEQTGHAGFRGYLEIAARHGVSIKRMGGSDNGLALTGIGAWILWGIELLIAAGLAGYMAYARAAAPFCEDCMSWFGAPQRIAAGGAGSRAARKDLISALQIGDLDRAAAVLAAPATASTFVLKATTCPRCSAESYCTLDRVTRKKAKDQVSSLESWLLTRTEMAQLGQAIARAKAGPGGTPPA